MNQGIEQRLRRLEQRVDDRRNTPNMVPELVLLPMVVAGLSAGAFVTNTYYTHDWASHIDAETKFNVQGYTVALLPPNHPEMDGNVVGRTYHNNDLLIQTDRAVDEVYYTCVHEYLHNQYPDAEHSWIYEQEDERVVPLCLETIKKAAEKNKVR